MAGELSHTHIHKEDFAAEIVYAAMEKKATDAHTQFKDAILERSREIVEDKRIELEGKFSPALMETKGSSFMARFRKGAQ